MRANGGGRRLAMQGTDGEGEGGGWLWQNGGGVVGMASNARGCGAGGRQARGDWKRDREEDLKNIEDKRKRGTADLKDSEPPTARQAEAP